jgi:hypothetical protein
VWCPRNRESIVLGPGALTADVLQSNGNLWQYQYTASGWTLRTELAVDVVDIWLVNGSLTLEAFSLLGGYFQFPA